MIIELGHYALVLSLVLSLVQAAVPLAGAARDRIAWMALGRQSSFSIAALLSIAFFSLAHAYALSDFSVLNVAQNSHTLKPLLYKISAVWGNHEGSMLLWVWLLSLWGVAVARRGHSLPPAFLARVLSVQGMVLSGFLLFVLLTSNPFLRLDPPAPEGLDLNPLLQDPALALHPPMLYMGYVGFSVAFCFAVAALLEGKIDAHWASRLRPWVLAAWAALTAGIALGSFWAYYELGWGGFWFWDPVENASLLPWLAGTALLHSVIVVEKRHALPGWTLFLAILAFSFSLLGTFLVRSGVLTSVHSFAVDPARGVFILALLGLTTGGAFLLYALRAPAMRQGHPFGVVSREAALLLNNVFLFTFAATVFTGTLYPLFLSALDLGSVSVGAPYFVATMLPLLFPFGLLMGASSFLPWREGLLVTQARKMVPPFLGVVAVAAFLLVLELPEKELTVPVLSLAAWILLTTLQDVSRKIFSASARSGTSLSWAGMVAAHAGFALLLAGAVLSTQWKSERILWMQPGDRTDIAGYEAAFLGAETDLGKNYNIARGILSLKKAGGEEVMLLPEKRWYPAAGKETSEVALRFQGASVLYAVMGDKDRDAPEKWVVRLYHHPFVLLVFAGAALIALGGMLPLLDRRRRHG